MKHAEAMEVLGFDRKIEYEGKPYRLRYVSLMNVVDVPARVSSIVNIELVDNKFISYSTIVSASNFISTVLTHDISRRTV